MKVGDLVKYKDHPDGGYGIIVNKDEECFYNLLIYWISKDPQYNDYVWESKGVLEVISESR